MTLRLQMTYYRTISFFIAAVCAMLFINVVTFYGPLFEGRLFPVAKSIKTNIFIPHQVPNTMLIDGRMSKFRDCELISTAAYISDSVGNRVLVKVAPRDTIKLRPIEAGVPWGPWKISVPMWFRKANLLIIVRHQCHPLWQTQSTFVDVTIE